jgi:hypothetical protein
MYETGGTEGAAFDGLEEIFITEKVIIFYSLSSLISTEVKEDVHSFELT